MSPSDVPPAPKKSRAGRNLPAAIGVGVGLGAVVIASLFVVKVAFVAVVVVVAGLGIYELCGALRAGGISVPLVPVLTGGVVMVAATYFGGAEVIAVAAALTVLGTLVWRLADGADGFVRDVTSAIFITGYVPVLGSFVMLNLAEDDGAWRVVAFIVCTVASDIGGYAAGVFLGKHPMAPAISPKKSWEGFAGSLVAGMAAGYCTVVFGLDGAWWAGVVLGAAAVVMATLGDLSESMIKRDLSIKDMGDLLPGHGGIMDRLDSLLAVAPIAWLVLHFLVPVTR